MGGWKKTLHNEELLRTEGKRRALVNAVITFRVP